MTRPTRQQRRARRAQRAQVSSTQRDGAAVQIPPFQYEKLPPAQAPARERSRFALVRFVAESVGELKKVDWPGRPQVIQGTVVVIIACAIVGGYLFLADMVIKRFVQTILIGQ